MADQIDVGRIFEAAVGRAPVSTTVAPPALTYRRMFAAGAEPTFAYDRGGVGVAVADWAASDAVYRFDDRIELAVNVALATARPLLVRGPSGCGKSSLARAVAAKLNWRYYEAVITSRTQARDLLYTFDALARLNDASAKKMKHLGRYIRPGPLWRAFDRDSARAQGAPADTVDSDASVVLIDEIDKADPDVPNGLLVPLGSHRFDVEETGRTVTASGVAPPLVVITSNDERELPAAFRRRCVTLTIDPPGPDVLVEIARRHYGTGEGRADLYRAIADLVRQFPSAGTGVTATVSTAEYLDTVNAALQTNTKPDPADATWQAISAASLRKA